MPLISFINPYSTSLSPEIYLSLRLSSHDKQLQNFPPLGSAHARRVGWSEFSGCSCSDCGWIEHGWLRWRIKWQLSDDGESDEAHAIVSCSHPPSDSSSTEARTALSLISLVDDTKAESEVKRNDVVECWGCWNGKLKLGWGRWNVYIEVLWVELVGTPAEMEMFFFFFF